MERPPAAYVHGLHGPVVVVPARVCAWLERHAGIAQLRAEHRGRDAEVSAVLVGVGVAAAKWRASATGTADAKRPESDAPSEMSTRQASDLVGVTERAIRQAIAEGRLTATRVGSRWVLTREDVEQYRASRTTRAA